MALGKRRPALPALGHDEGLRGSRWPLSCCVSGGMHGYQGYQGGQYHGYQGMQTGYTQPGYPNSGYPPDGRGYPPPGPPNHQGSYQGSYQQPGGYQRPAYTQGQPAFQQDQYPGTLSRFLIEKNTPLRA
ncbi:hypothetical protein E2C01_012915 [Portunus trituberculatus]|uniref:Uncharacterized protein n=1 Tax=Portunus trituberculatus TaxID=210409 RepID=A0A5B7DFY4_PORTR|nr:hypothetical protein [Portunus trituberculatus]